MMNRCSINPTRAGSLAAAFAVVAVAAGLVLTAAPSTVYAYDVTSAAVVNVDQDKVILRGYDAVAYFTENKAVKGSPQFSATHEGATYHFASAENRDAFAADAAKYAPQFGGFCAMGAAMGRKLDGDPELFRVVDGRLYVNVGKPQQTRWLKDVPGNIQQANANWPSIRDKAPQEVNKK